LKENDHTHLGPELSAPVTGLSSLTSYHLSLSLHSFTVKTERASSSKMLFHIDQTKQHHMPEHCDPTLNYHIELNTRWGFFLKSVV